MLYLNLLCLLFKPILIIIIVRFQKFIFSPVLLPHFKQMKNNPFYTQIYYIKVFFLYNNYV
jgi:hypothetical protein